jgi:hypothetical protein
MANITHKFSNSLEGALAGGGSGLSEEEFGGRAVKLNAGIIFVDRFYEGAWAYFLFLPLLYLMSTIFRRRLGKPTTAEERLGRRLASRPITQLGVERWPML